MNQEKPTYEQLESELKALKIKHEDVWSQLTELRRGIIITAAEQMDIARLRAEHQSMHEERSKIALWLRENKQAEIAKGDHNGLGVAGTCILYMAKSIPWWKRLMQAWKRL